MRDWNFKYYALVLLGLNILIRLTFVLFPFWGLEYEDSFIFNDTARQLAHNYIFTNDFFITCSCTSGSIEDCSSMASFGGHFITFPFLLFLLNAIVGYSSSNILLFNFSISCLLLIIVYVFHKRYGLKDQFSIKVFLTLMLITPFISIFNTSGLSETFSCFFVTFSVFSFYLANNQNFKISRYSFWITVVLLIIAFLTKRENVILLALFFVVPFLRIYFKRKAFVRDYWIMMGLTLVVACLAFVLLNVISIETNEASDINAPTFSIFYLLDNSANFGVAMFKFQFWGVTGVLLILSLVLLIFKRSITPFGLYCFVIAMLFYIVYCSHYRSYYHVKYDRLNPFETLRYTVNYFPLICLFIASISFKSARLTQLNYQKYWFWGLIIIIGLSINTVFSRINLHKVEYVSRIEPVKKTLSSASESDIIVTDIPIVFHCFASEKQPIIDIFTLSPQKFDSLLSLSTIDVYMCARRSNSEDYERYNFEVNINKYCNKEILLLNEDYQLLKFQKCY